MLANVRTEQVDFEVVRNCRSGISTFAFSCTTSSDKRR